MQEKGRRLLLAFYYFIRHLTQKKLKELNITIEALQGCLAKSMLALEALICFSRSFRLSAFLRAPVFFLGIFHFLGKKHLSRLVCPVFSIQNTWLFFSIFINESIKMLRCKLVELLDLQWPFLATGPKMVIDYYTHQQPITTTVSKLGKATLVLKIRYKPLGQKSKHRMKINCLTEIKGITQYIIQ